MTFAEFEQLPDIEGCKQELVNGVAGSAPGFEVLRRLVFRRSSQRGPDYRSPEEYDAGLRSRAGQSRSLSRHWCIPVGILPPRDQPRGHLRGS